MPPTEKGNSKFDLVSKVVTPVVMLVVGVITISGIFLFSVRDYDFAQSSLAAANNLLASVGLVVSAPTNQVTTSISTQSRNEVSQGPSNLNSGTITIRAIVANIDEVSNKYGSYGMKFAPSKLAEVDQALGRLNTFVRQTSYGKAKLQWTTSGVYELGSGVCNHVAYGDKVNDLIQRALQKEDSQTKFSDYSYYFIVHPVPDCQDGVRWSYSGKGTFAEYTLNGRLVHLRGLEISDLSDFYVFHEFGHSLGYQPNGGIGHPDYMNCPVGINNGEVQIALSDSCPGIYGQNGQMPAFSMMSNKFGFLSDYSATEKENVGWLVSADIVTASQGHYTLSPIEQTGPRPKALKIPTSLNNYDVYVSFRQPIGYNYPSAPANKPNGVIIEIANKAYFSTHFLVTEEIAEITRNTNMDVPLKIGVPYRLGIKGPVVTVNSISNNLAFVTVTTVPAGQIQISRVGADGVAPAATPKTNAWVDKQTQDQTNPSLFSFTTRSAHTVSATYVPGYKVNVGMCTYAQGSSECTVPTTAGPGLVAIGPFVPLTCNTTTKTCSYPLTVNPPVGKVIKVVFQYIKQ